MAKKDDPKLVTVLLRDVPFDMMRYDGAYPHTEADAGKLERLCHRTFVVDAVLNKAGVPETTEDRTVTFVATKPGAPTMGRWKSFGCQVLKVEPVQ